MIPVLAEVGKNIKIVTGNECKKLTAEVCSVSYVDKLAEERMGSAAGDLAYVVNGRFEAFYEYSLHPWDVAAGALIVQQADGKVSNFAGSGDYIFGKDFVATNVKIYDFI